MLSIQKYNRRLEREFIPRGAFPYCGSIRRVGEGVIRTPASKACAGPAKCRLEELGGEYRSERRGSSEDECSPEFRCEGIAE